jgi:protein O-GlcNAc transferase
LSSHDHKQFEVFCYSAVEQPDAITERLRSCADGWRETARLSDEKVAEMVLADRVDILVDLTMHMAGNRLQLFARKPAPIQVTWLAYPGTSGLSAMDYRLSDPYLDPPGMFEECYSEQTIRLPESFWCYDPLTQDPALNALPALTAGHITFGCLNNFCKVNAGVLTLWSRVLQAVPGSRMIILCIAGESRERTLALFAQNGIADDRIEFADPLPRPKYLELYHRIDLALDTFPYNGHTTSLDALWMGVPVVTLVGQTVVGRAGLCQSMNLGMPEFIAQTPEEYVAIASRVTVDLSRLATIRAALRARMESSPLMQGPRFARNMEAAYREMWRRWCIA